MSYVVVKIKEIRILGISNINVKVLFKRTRYEEYPKNALWSRLGTVKRNNKNIEKFLARSFFFRTFINKIQKDRANFVHYEQALPFPR